MAIWIFVVGTVAGCVTDVDKQEKDSGTSNTPGIVEQCGAPPESSCRCIMYSEPVEGGFDDTNDPCNSKPGILISAIFECPVCTDDGLSKHYLEITNFGKILAEGAITIRVFENNSGKHVADIHDTVGMVEKETVSVQISLAPGEESTPILVREIADNTVVVVDITEIDNCYQTGLGWNFDEVEPYC